MSKLEETLALLILAYELPEPIREYKFVRDIVGNEPGVRARIKEAGLKDWRFDFAWLDIKLAVEVEGGAWTRGRHTRGKGFVNDMVKYNTAALEGWVVLRFATNHLSDGYAIETISKFFN